MQGVDDALPGVPLQGDLLEAAVQAERLVAQGVRLVAGHLIGVQGIGELVDVVEAGDRVAVIMRSTATDEEQPTLTANVTTFRDGKAVEMVSYPTPEEALTAVGLER